MNPSSLSKQLLHIGSSSMSSQINDGTYTGPQGLQELVDVLQEPFQKTCDGCEGSGVTRLHGECKACKGRGKVIADSLY